MQCFVIRVRVNVKISATFERELCLRAQTKERPKYTHKIVENLAGLTYL